MSNAQSVYDILVVQYSRSLKALRGLLTKAREFASERQFDENNFLLLRAAPDMFPFSKQIQIATDSAKLGAARLSGKDAPVFEDNETTLEQLIARVDKTLEFLNGLKPGDFDAYATKKVTFHWKKGVHMEGKDYFESHSLPNFYFHMTTAYLLLRSHGVKLGKADFLGEQNWIKD